MGEAADRKVNEIDETRHRIEADLQELEDRMPAPLRSVKGLIGAMVGTAGGALVLRKLLSRRSQRKPATEVVVRVVRDDEREPLSSEREAPWRSRRASRRTSTD